MADKFSEAYLYAVFRQCHGQLAKMSRIDGIPSKQTLCRYKKKYGWDKRLTVDKERQKQFLVDRDFQKLENRKAIIETYESLLDEVLLPEKDPDTGEFLRDTTGHVIWKGPEPKDFEKLLSQRLSIARDMAGLNPPETQIINILQINLNQVCDTFGKVLKEFIDAGRLQPGVAKELALQFTEEANKLDFRLESDIIPSSEQTSS